MGSGNGRQNNTRPFLLAALSLFCATVAWAADHAVSPRSSPRSGQSPFSAPQPRGTGADMDSEQKKDMVLLVALALVGGILVFGLFTLAVARLMR
jgi:hypothetical protein